MTTSKDVPAVRTAIECLAKDDILTASGEVKLPDDIRGRLHISDLSVRSGRRLVMETRSERLEVRDEVRSQTPDIKAGSRQRWRFMTRE